MRTLTALALATVLTPGLAAQDLALSLDATTSVGGTTYADDQVLAHTGASTFVNDISGLTSALPPTADINAIDYVTPTNVYFSLDAAAVLSGAGLVQDEDVVNWNGSTFALAWDGSANGLPANADIDALDVIGEGPLVFSFSLDAAAVLVGPGTVEDEDLALWNGVAVDATLDFDGSAEGVPARLDLDAFNRRSASEWVMSFDAPATIDGVAMDDEDLATFDTGTNAFTGLFFDGSSQALLANVDLNAAEATPNQVPVEMSVFATE
jgi:hypothetical protein